MAPWKRDLGFRPGVNPAKNFGPGSSWKLSKEEQNRASSLEELPACWVKTDLDKDT